MFLKTDNFLRTYSSGFLSGKKVSTLQNTSITVRDEETVGIFGKGGSGKTTLANLIAGAIPASSGRVFWDDEPVVYPYRGALRQAIQMIYQHLEEAFDPCWSLEQGLMGPYRIHRLNFSEEKFTALLEQVGLYKERLSRDLSSLSGEKLQRAALVRAMSMSPKLVLLDEPTNMLDSISQAQILQILKTYQKQHRAAYLLITHDLQIMCHMYDRCYSLENGCIQGGEEYTHVEKGP